MQLDDEPVNTVYVNDLKAFCKARKIGFPSNATKPLLQAIVKNSRKWRLTDEQQDAFYENATRQHNRDLRSESDIGDL